MQIRFGDRGLFVSFSKDFFFLLATMGLNLWWRESEEKEEMGRGDTLIEKVGLQEFRSRIGPKERKSQ